MLLRERDIHAVAAQRVEDGQTGLTSEVYMGRAPSNRAAAAALEEALTDGRLGSESGRFPRTQVEPGPRGRALTCMNGAPPGTRTPNPVIKSHLLCQLS